MTFLGFFTTLHSELYIESSVDVSRQQSFAFKFSSKCGVYTVQRIYLATLRVTIKVFCTKYIYHPSDQKTELNGTSYTRHNGILFISSFFSEEDSLEKLGYVLCLSDGEILY